MLLGSKNKQSEDNSNVVVSTPLAALQYRPTVAFPSPSSPVLDSSTKNIEAKVNQTEGILIPLYGYDPALGTCSKGKNNFFVR